ncbi:MAG: hypothetical protein AAFO82_11085 [Bacteroidota bacterium]
MLLDTLKRSLNKRVLQKQPKPIKRQPTNLESAQWIGILFDATTQKNREEILTYKKKLEKSGKKVQLLAYINSRSKELDYNFPFFIRREVDWRGVPQSKAIEDFATRSFDLLLVIHPKTSIVFEYIVTLTDARLKVGPYTEDTKSYDFMVQTDDSTISEFINQIEKYVDFVKPYPKAKRTTRNTKNKRITSTAI